MRGANFAHSTSWRLAATFNFSHATKLDCSNCSGVRVNTFPPIKKICLVAFTIRETGIHLFSEQWYNTPRNTSYLSHCWVTCWIKSSLVNNIYNYCWSVGVQIYPILLPFGVTWHHQSRHQWTHNVWLAIDGEREPTIYLAQLSRKFWVMTFTFWGHVTSWY